MQSKRTMRQSTERAESSAESTTRPFAFATRARPRPQRPKSQRRRRKRRRGEQAVCRAEIRDDEKKELDKFWCQWRKIGKFHAERSKQTKNNRSVRETDDTN